MVSYHCVLTKIPVMLTVMANKDTTDLKQQAPHVSGSNVIKVLMLACDFATPFFYLSLKIYRENPMN